jgi:hypothetical protein
MARDALVQFYRGGGVVGDGNTYEGEPSYDTTNDRLFVGGTDTNPKLIGGPEFLRTLSLTGADDADGTGTLTIQVKDGLNATNVSERILARIWSSGTTEYAAPSALTDLSVTTGTQIEEVTADADYWVLSNGSGQIVMNVNTATNDTFYFTVAYGKTVYSESIAITGN